MTIPACLIQVACKQASVSPKAQSLRDELTKCIKKAKRPANNISKGEFKALQELKADTDITILPADKGRSTIILNTKDYESKLSTLLSNSNTYEKPQKDPTLKFKRTDQMIQRWQTEDPIPTILKHFIYSRIIPKMYGLPKIHKANVLLRTIVASQGSLTLNASRVLADMFGPPGGQIRTPHPEQW